METPNFAQTCGTYDNKTFRRPTFYRHFRHPSPIPLSLCLSRRPQTPFTRRKRLNAQDDSVIDAFDLPIDVSTLDVSALDVSATAVPAINNDRTVFDTDSDVSDDEGENYIKGADLTENIIKQTYYCRRCFEKFKKRFTFAIKKKIKISSV